MKSAGLRGALKEAERDQQWKIKAMTNTAPSQAALDLAERLWNLWEASTDRRDEDAEQAALEIDRFVASRLSQSETLETYDKVMAHASRCTIDMLTKRLSRAEAVIFAALVDLDSDDEYGARATLAAYRSDTPK